MAKCMSSILYHIITMLIVIDVKIDAQQKEEKTFTKTTNEMTQEIILRDMNQYYKCVHILPQLENCNFSIYDANMDNSLLSETGQPKKTKGQVLKNIKKNIQPSSINAIGSERQIADLKNQKIIIYQIQNCVPHRLPFDLPWCTEEDLANKKKEIYRLTPYVRRNKNRIPR